MSGIIDGAPENIEDASVDVRFVEPGEFFIQVFGAFAFEVFDAVYADGYQIPLNARPDPGNILKIKRSPLLLHVCNILYGRR